MRDGHYVVDPGRKALIMAAPATADGGHDGALGPAVMRLESTGSVDDVLDLFRVALSDMFTIMEGILSGFQAQNKSRDRRSRR